MRRLLPFLLVALVWPAAAGAARSRCIPGDAGSPMCSWWNAKVTLVADGDTINAKIPGQGDRTIRFIGINAMELRVYSHTASKRRGECMGVAAADFVDHMVKASHGRVRLAAQRPSSRSGHRLRRSVWVKSHGRWVDLDRAEIAAGYDLFLPNKDEWAHNLEYQKLAARARAAGRNLWNPRACGGPEQGAKIAVAANWDADGNDEQNLDGEYIDISNRGSGPLDLSRWWARDSWLNYWHGVNHGTPGYPFARGTTVPAGGKLRLYIGCGHDGALSVHWCQKSSAFENVTYDKTHMGDGAYLFDPKGDLRASFMYPCELSCVDPDAGKVRIVPHPSRDESVAIRNTSGAPIDLGDHVLKLRNHGRAGEYVFGHVFPPGTTVKAGGTYTYVHDSANRYSDNGGVIELRTLDDQLTACADWGFGHC
jgi:endonuclease YncB( thermonuclease family)